MVRTIDGETSPVVLYVDVTNGDILRTETLYLALSGDVSVRSIYEDYRVVGGLRFPHRITSTTKMNGDVIQEIEQIKFQQEFSEELFAL